MLWQDIVISVCQLLFVVALWPSLRSHHKPAASSSIMNAVLISVITACLLSLQLWFAGFTAALVGITWVVLAVQKIKIENQKAAKKD